MKTIRLITDHPKNKRWKTFYECPSAFRTLPPRIVATNEFDEWICSCSLSSTRKQECSHIRNVQIALLFLNESGEQIPETTMEKLPKPVKKAASRFSMVEL